LIPHGLRSKRKNQIDAVFIDPGAILAREARIKTEIGR